MGVLKNVSEAVGNTPLLLLEQFGVHEKADGVLMGKLESMNPTGSVKDRAALSMLKEAMAEGRLQPGAVIIEPTSGNTGIGLAAMGTALGFQVILTMPDTMSMERRMLLKAYGAELVLTPGAQGMKGAIAKAKELAETTPNSFFPGQFDNPDNVKAHYTTTGPEIWRDTEGKVDVFVAGVGTGGTLTGVGRYLKAQNPNVKIVAVEPADSPVLSGGQPGAHKIQGIGAGFVPDNLDTEILDEVVQVQNEVAFATARLLARTEGILCGISSGAALWAAKSLLERPAFSGKTIVVLLPDGGDRYLSSGLYE